METLNGKDESLSVPTNDVQELIPRPRANSHRVRIGESEKKGEALLYIPPADRAAVKKGTDAAGIAIPAPQHKTTLCLPYRVVLCGIHEDGYNEGAHAKVHVRAFTAFLASVLLWVGAWDIVSPNLKNGILADFSLSFASTLHGKIIYIVLGLLLTNLCGSYFPCAGIATNLNTTKRFSVIQQFWENHKSVYIQSCRGAVSFLGIVTLWSGYYNLLDGFWEASVLRDSLYLMVGLLGVLATNTVYWMAYCYPSDFEYPVKITSWTEFIKIFIRATVSLVFQNFIWVGSYNLLELHSSEPSAFREVAFAMLGISALQAVGTFITASWIPVEYEWEAEAAEEVAEEEPNPELSHLVVEPDPDPLLSLAFCTRVIISLGGFIVANTGIWTLLDVYMYKESLYRNIIYVIGASLLLHCSKGLTVNLGIS